MEDHFVIVDEEIDDAYRDWFGPCAIYRSYAINPLAFPTFDPCSALLYFVTKVD